MPVCGAHALKPRGKVSPSGSMIPRCGNRRNFRTAAKKSSGSIKCECRGNSAATQGSYSARAWRTYKCGISRMEIQVGRFICTLSIGDRGEVQATWLPWQPKYLDRNERAQYRAG